MDFGYEFFAGFIGTVMLLMAITAIFLYSAISAMLARWELYKCEHPLLKD